MKKVTSDIEGLILQVQQQLTYLDKKIEELIAQVSARPAEAPQYRKPFGHSQPYQQRYENPGRRGEARPSGDFRDRVMHKTVCAECNKECEVPFRPSGERPVYCKDCFSRRKTESSFRPGRDNRPREEERFNERPPRRHTHSENRRPYAKKNYTKKHKKH